MYDIGDYVIVHSKAIRGGTYPKVTWESRRMGKKILGRVVGKKIVYDGKIEQSGFDYFEPNPAYFVPSSKIEGGS